MVTEGKETSRSAVTRALGGVSPLSHPKIANNDLYWLAGLVEGEGTFLKGSPSNPGSPSIAVQMTDEDIVKRIANLFDVKYHNSKRGPEHHKRVYSVRLTGRRAVAFMQLLKPLMGIRRQVQIDKALNSYNRHPRYKLIESDISSIKDRLTKGETHASIAKSFNIDRSTVTAINAGRIWRI